MQLLDLPDDWLIEIFVQITESAALKYILLSCKRTKALTDRVIRQLRSRKKDSPHYVIFYLVIFDSDVAITTEEFIPDEKGVVFACRWSNRENHKLVDSIVAAVNKDGNPIEWNLVLNHLHYKHFKNNYQLKKYNVVDGAFPLIAFFHHFIELSCKESVIVTYKTYHPDIATQLVYDSKWQNKLVEFVDPDLPLLKFPSKPMYTMKIPKRVI